MLLADAQSASDAIALEGNIIAALGTVIAAILSYMAIQITRRSYHAKKTRYAAEETRDVTTTLAQDAAEIKTDAAVIRGQVKNSHDSNLREDLDAIRELVLEQGKKQDKHRDEMTRDIGGLRGDLRQVREDASADREENRLALRSLRNLVRKNRQLPGPGPDET